MPKSKVLVVFLILAVWVSGCGHSSVKATGARANSSVDPLLSEEVENRNLSFRDLGYFYYLRADFPRAISALEASLLIDPQASENWSRYLLFYCYLTTGDYRSAMKYAEDIVKADSFFPLPYQQAGLAQLWQGQAAAALQNFQRALEFESHAPRVHFYVGIAHAQLKQEAAKEAAFQNAVTEYQQILKANPKDFTANYELAFLYLYWNKELEKASLLVNAAKESVSQAPEEDLSPDRKLFVHHYVPLLEGILLNRTGNMRASLQAIYHALANAPSGAKADLAEIYFYLGKNYMELKERSSARQFLERSLAMDPHGPYLSDLQKAMRENGARGNEGL